jgi:hypothetical protein
LPVAPNKQSDFCISNQHIYFQFSFGPIPGRELNYMVFLQLTMT